MSARGITKVYDDLELLIRQRRAGAGDVVAVKRLMLLADPSRLRTKGGMRHALRETVEALEAVGAVVIELDTGRRRDDPKAAEQMMLDAIDELARTRRGSSIGRPRRVWPEDKLTIMRLHWFDHRIQTNREAADQIRAAGVDATISQIMKALGPSKRMAGNPGMRPIADGFSRRKGEVYFIQSGDEDGPIKIGYAANVRARFSAMQTGTPVKLTLLATMPGGQGREMSLHSRFDRYRMSGEWFKYEGELRQFVMDLRSKPKKPKGKVRR